MTTEDLFQKYLAQKYKDINMASGGAGPVITISREMGCFAIPIVIKLIDKINEKLEQTGSPKKWTWMSKELLEKSASELHINPKDIAHVFEGKGRGFFKDVAESLFSNFYVPDDSIISTIKYIIRSMAYEGNVIIVGRASSIIAKDVHKSLHIKFIAPYDWRIKNLVENMHVTVKAAQDEIKEIDKKRDSYMSFYSGAKNEIDYFDLIINRSKFKEDELVDYIFQLGEQRHLF